MQNKQKEDKKKKNIEENNKSRREISDRKFFNQKFIWRPLEKW